MAKAKNNRLVVAWGLSTKTTDQELPVKERQMCVDDVEKLPKHILSQVSQEDFTNQKGTWRVVFALDEDVEHVLYNWVRKMFPRTTLIYIPIEIVEKCE